jgi:hypothetical protein
VTSETPHFKHNPFPKAYEEGLVNQVSSLYASLMLHLNKLVLFVPGKLLGWSNIIEEYPEVLALGAQL